MTPNTWLGIVGFFFFVTPGLYYDRKSARKRTKPPETTFAEISRVALVSTLCSVPAILLLVGFARICAWQRWQLLPDPRALLIQGTSYFANHLVSVSVTFVATAAVALLTADLSFRWVHRNDKGKITFESAWREVLREEAPLGTVSYVRVSMKDESVWTGKVAHFSRSAEVGDREIVLEPPITRKAKPKPDGTYSDSQDFPAVYERVVLKYAEIAYLAVRYEPTPAAVNGSAATRASSTPAPPLPVPLPVPGPVGP
ncbi:DUF6338 family protein [Nocardia asteroides]|uniref:DUF6338 family protein n=1 Tax=Nocardia asteroides TaxID=1824 RepID=UPI003427F917